MILSPWFVFGSPDLRAADLKAAARGALPPGVKLADIGAFLVSLHDEGGTNMLGVLHSLGYTKGILNELRFPESLRLRAFARYAALGARPSLLGASAEEKARWRTNPGSETHRGLLVLLAAARVEILAWFVFVLAPLAPILFSLPGTSVWTASVAVSGPVYFLAAMSFVFARATEHPELAM